MNLVSGMCLGSCHCFPQATCEANSLFKSGNDHPSYGIKTRATETNNRKQKGGRGSIFSSGGGIGGRDRGRAPAQSTWRMMKPPSWMAHKAALLAVIMRPAGHPNLGCPTSTICFTAGEAGLRQGAQTQRDLL